MKVWPLLAVLLVVATRSHAQLPTDDAAKISQQINAITSDYTDTLVTPTDGKEGVIVVSMKVLASEKVAKLWHFVAACAVGKYYNDNGNASVEEIWFADPTDLAAKPPRYAVLKLPVAKAVQSQLYNGTMDVEVGQSKIWSSLERKSITKE